MEIIRRISLDDQVCFFLITTINFYSGSVFQINGSTVPTTTFTSSSSLFQCTCQLAETFLPKFI